MSICMFKNMCIYIYIYNAVDGSDELMTVQFLSNSIHIWVLPKIGVPQNGWFIMENPIKVDDLGVPLFLEAPIYIYIYKAT